MVSEGMKQAITSWVNSQELRAGDDFEAYNIKVLWACLKRCEEQQKYIHMHEVFGRCLKRCVQQKKYSLMHENYPPTLRKLVREEAFWDKYREENGLPRQRSLVAIRRDKPV